MSRRLLIIEPEGGLANRLRAILTADALAEEGERDLRVMWLPVDGPYGMRASLSDLFATCPLEMIVPVPAGARSIIQAGGVDRLPAVDPCGPERVLHVKSCFPLASPSQLDGARSYPTGGPAVFQSLHGLTRSAAGRFTRLFTPSMAVAELMAGHKPKDHTGVHVRRGDNTWAAQASPMYLFEKRLSRATPPFWLSTDSTVVEARLSSFVQGPFHWMPKNRKNDSRGPEGVQEALADLLLLSETRRVLGSACSSFGPLAAAIGGVEFEMVGPEEKP